MKRLTICVAVLAALAMGHGSALAANKGLSGVWQITFFAGPKGVRQPTLCVRFVQTNNIAGYTKFSGNWVSTSSTSLAGQWIQNGDDVMWYGVNGNISFFSVGDIISDKTIGGTGYAQFKNNKGTTQTAGTWSGRKDPDCVPTPDE